MNLLNADTFVAIKKRVETINARNGKSHSRRKIKRDCGAAVSAENIRLQKKETKIKTKNKRSLGSDPQLRRLIIKKNNAIKSRAVWSDISNRKDFANESGKLNEITRSGTMPASR